MPYLIATVCLACLVLGTSLVTAPDGTVLDDIAGILALLGSVVCLCSLGVIRAVDRLRKIVEGRR